MRAIKRAPGRDGARREVRSRRHRRALEIMTGVGVPFLVGGGHALRYYIGNVRGTKDLDVFVRRSDALDLLEGLPRVDSIPI